MTKPEYKRGTIFNAVEWQQIYSLTALYSIKFSFIFGQEFYSAGDAEKNINQKTVPLMMEKTLILAFIILFAGMAAAEVTIDTIYVGTGQTESLVGNVRPIDIYSNDTVTLNDGEQRIYLVGHASINGTINSFDFDDLVLTSETPGIQNFRTVKMHLFRSTGSGVINDYDYYDIKFYEGHKSVEDIKNNSGLSEIQPPTSGVFTIVAAVRLPKKLPEYPLDSIIFSFRYNQNNQEKFAGLDLGDYTPIQITNNNTEELPKELYVIDTETLETFDQDDDGFDDKVTFDMTFCPTCRDISSENPPHYFINWFFRQNNNTYRQDTINIELAYEYPVFSLNTARVECDLEENASNSFWNTLISQPTTYNISCESNTGKMLEEWGGNTAINLVINSKIVTGFEDSVTKFIKFEFEDTEDLFDPVVFNGAPEYHIHRSPNVEENEMSVDIVQVQEGNPSDPNNIYMRIKAINTDDDSEYFNDIITIETGNLGAPAGTIEGTDYAYYTISNVPLQWRGSYPGDGDRVKLEVSLFKNSDASGRENLMSKAELFFDFEPSERSCTINVLTNQGLVREDFEVEIATTEGFTNPQSAEIDCDYASNFDGTTFPDFQNSPYTCNYTSAGNKDILVKIQDSGIGVAPTPCNIAQVTVNEPTCWITAQGTATVNSQINIEVEHQHFHSTPSGTITIDGTNYNISGSNPIIYNHTFTIAGPKTISATLDGTDCGDATIDVQEESEIELVRAWAEPDRVSKGGEVIIKAEIINNTEHGTLSITHDIQGANTPTDITNAGYNSTYEFNPISNFDTTGTKQLTVNFSSDGEDIGSKVVTFLVTNDNTGTEAVPELHPIFIVLVAFGIMGIINLAKRE